MKKQLLLLLLFLFAQTILGQRLEVFGGMNRNNFISRTVNGEKTPEKPGFGYTGGVGVDVKVLKKATLGLVVKVDHYEGSFNVSGGGLGGGYSVEANINKTVFAIGAYPLNLILVDKLRLGMGLEFNTLISQKIEGEVQSYGVDWGPTGTTYFKSQTFAIDEAYAKKMEEKNSAGLVTRISYDLKISKNWYMVPQYQFFYGFYSEYGYVPTEAINSCRHNLYLGVARKF